MFIRKAVLVGLALLGLTWTHTGSTQACECFPPRSVADEFEASVAVFLGEVIDHDLEDPAPIGRIRFRVLNSWKGVSAPQVCVSNMFYFDCALFDVHIGQELLVYAGLDTRDRTVLAVHQCTRTGQLDGALQDVDRLAQLGYEPLELDGPQPGNFDGDASLELSDFAKVASCLTGPSRSGACEAPLYVNPCCAIADSDDDGDVDLKDVAAFQLAYTGD